MEEATRFENSQGTENPLEIDYLRLIDHISKYINNTFALAYKDDIERYHYDLYIECNKSYAYSLVKLGTILHRIYKNYEIDEARDKIDLLTELVEANYRNRDGNSVRVSIEDINPNCRVNKDNREYFTRKILEEYGNDIIIEDTVY